LFGDHGFINKIVFQGLRIQLSDRVLVWHSLAHARCWIHSPLLQREKEGERGRERGKEKMIVIQKYPNTHDHNCEVTKALSKLELASAHLTRG
jgi:hypothetical protein